MGVAVPFDKYLLLGRVNVGGMAEVFLSKTFGAEGFERFVAIKRLLPQMMHNKEFIDMFIDEAKIAVQLNHANIAQIYELGKHAQQLFIALEYVHGKELRALAVRAKKLGRHIDPNIAAYIISKAADGLDYAHQKKDPSGRPLGIIHRDISPQNILVSFEGEIKIIDFGIAKAKDRISQTQVGVLKGKIGYMSPEQVMGVAIDQRSDIFSLGCVLYELVTGERAFKGASDFSTFEKVRSAQYVPPAAHHIQVDPALDRIMRKALAGDREQRYSRASELSTDLQRFLLRQDLSLTADSVAEVMRDVFPNEYDAEMKKLAEYRLMKPPPELVGKEEEELEEAEALIEDHTRVVTFADVKTNTEKIAFTADIEDDDGADRAEKTVSEKLIVARSALAQSKNAGDARVIDKTVLDLDMSAVQTAVLKGAPPPAKTGPRPRVTETQEIENDIRSAFRAPHAASAPVLALTRKKTEPGPIAPRKRTPSWSSGVGEVNDSDIRSRGPVHMGERPELSRTLTDLDLEEGFTIGEILLIVGAGVVAVLFVVGVYWYTMRNGGQP